MKKKRQINFATNTATTNFPITEKRKVLTITDRKEAIKTAVALAKKNDIILLAGKGHEKYQEIKGVKNHFDDKLLILSNNKYK